MYKVWSLTPPSTTPDLSGSRCLQLALAFSAFLQLAAFFSIMAIGLWIDRASCSEITTLAQNVREYQSSFFVLAAVSILISGLATTRQADHGVPDHYSMDYIRMSPPLSPKPDSNHTG